MSRLGPFSLLSLAQMVEFCATPLAREVGKATALPAEQMLSLCGQLRPATMTEALLLEALHAYAMHESDRLATASARSYQRSLFNRAYKEMFK